MAIHMVCTCGQEMFTEDEHAGRKVRCPNCKGIIVVPGARLVPVQRDRGPREDEDEEEERRDAGLSTRDRLGRARIGLGLHWGKTLCFLIVAGFALLASIVLFVVTLVGTVSRAGAGEGGATAMITVSVALSCAGFVGLFVMPVLSAVGSLLCFWLPQRSGGRVLSLVGCGLDTAAFLFLGLSMIVYFSAVASTVSRRGPPSMEDLLMSGGIIAVLIVLTYLLMLAGWILHMLVLKNVAGYVRERYAESDALRMVIIGAVVLVVPGILIWVLMRVFVGARTGPAGLLVLQFLMVAWSGGLLAVAYRLLNLITTVRRRL